MKLALRLLLVILPACGGPAPTRPPPAPRGLDALADRDGLLPTPEVERARHTRALAGEVEAALLALDGVVAARVLLTLPVPGPARAAIVVRRAAGRAPPLSHALVRSLATAAVPGLSPEAVEVVVSPERPEAPSELVTVGPVRVARDSRLALLALVGGLAALCLALSLVLVGRGLLSRRAGPRGWRG